MALINIIKWKALHSNMIRKWIFPFLIEKSMWKWKDINAKLQPRERNDLRYKNSISLFSLLNFCLAKGYSKQSPTVRENFYGLFLSFIVDHKNKKYKSCTTYKLWNTLKYYEDWIGFKLSWYQEIENYAHQFLGIPDTYTGCSWTLCRSFERRTLST